MPTVRDKERCREPAAAAGHADAKETGGNRGAGAGSGRLADAESVAMAGAINCRPGTRACSCESTSKSSNESAWRTCNVVVSGRPVVCRHLRQCRIVTGKLAPELPLPLCLRR